MTRGTPLSAGRIVIFKASVSELAGSVHLGEGNHFFFSQSKSEQMF